MTALEGEMTALEGEMTALEGEISRHYIFCTCSSRENLLHVDQLDEPAGALVKRPAFGLGVR